MTPVRCSKHEDGRYCAPPYYPPLHCGRCFALYLWAHAAYRVMRALGKDR